MLPYLAVRLSFISNNLPRRPIGLALSTASVGKRAVNNLLFVCIAIQLYLLVCIYSYVFTCAFACIEQCLYRTVFGFNLQSGKQFSAFESINFALAILSVTALFERRPGGANEGAPIKKLNAQAINGSLLNGVLKGEKCLSTLQLDS